MGRVSVGVGAAGVGVGGIGGMVEREEGVVMGEGVGVSSGVGVGTLPVLVGAVGVVKEVGEVAGVWVDAEEGVPRGASGVAEESEGVCVAIP